MNRFLYILLISAFLLLLPSAALSVTAPEQVENVQLRDDSRFVTDGADILSPDTEDTLNDLLANLRAHTTAEVVVVTIDAMPEDTDIDTYATSLFSLWGIGRDANDNGLLLLVSRDDRRYAIRTGYGLEGILPDVTLGRIEREVMTPAFRQGDYDEGVLQAVSRIATVILNPDNAGDVVAPRRQKQDDWLGVITTYLAICLAISIAMLIWVLVTIRRQRNVPFQQALKAFDRIQLPIGMLTAFTLGLGLMAYIPLSIARKRARNRGQDCPNCGTRMVKLSETEDNRYLTPAQDAEERLGSVDYDVFLCPNCNEVDIYPYVNRSTPFKPCPHCKGMTSRLMVDRIITPPSTTQTGRGIRTYQCYNCGRSHDVPYNIPRRDDDGSAGGMAAAIAAGILFGAARGGGGGGSVGGGFGGGSTGGGGASGGW